MFYERERFFNFSPDKMVIIVSIILVLSVITYTTGCSVRNEVTLKDNILISHLVGNVKITGESNTDDGQPIYQAKVVCVLKDNRKHFEQSIQITQIGTLNSGKCFTNSFKVNETYIVFLRQLQPNIYRPYNAELPTSRITEVIDECENSNICTADYTSNRHSMAAIDCKTSSGQVSAMFVKTFHPVILLCLIALVFI